MSSAVFPSLSGITYPQDRTPIWDTMVQPNVSGKEMRLAQETYPRYQWDLAFSALRQGTVGQTNYTELDTLLGFFNSRQGSFDSFLFTDPKYNSISGQQIGIGDGVTAVFQLTQAQNGFIEPVLAPNVVQHVFNNGVDGGGWVVGLWGTSSAGQIIYTGAVPTMGNPITASFSYYWPCRFLDDKFPLSQFNANMYEVKKLSIISVKN
jgi:uncharacterized protein (TIGR02217 family)